MNIIKTNNSSPVSDVFYGSVRINGKEVSVSNHLKSNTEVYTFRMIDKARAGFQTIRDYEGPIQGLIQCMTKHTTAVQVEVKCDGKSYWFLVLTTKGGKWDSIDKGILELLTVGDMHGCFSKMVDWDMWKKLNTKTWASMAFMQNAA
jgi:hypothetical protein